MGPEIEVVQEKGNYRIVIKLSCTCNHGKRIVLQ